MVRPKHLAAFLLCVAHSIAFASAGNADLVVAARNQVGVTVRYDPAYRALAYPGGDVPMESGVCTDVIVRALRTARGVDLQKQVHEDMTAHWDAYPHSWKWRLSKPDANIDHRRVPNLMTYFQRAGLAVPITGATGDYLPGDIVAWDLGRGILHIGIVSDARSVAGVPLVIHNIGAGAREEDLLLRFTIIGHYRPKLPAIGALPGIQRRAVSPHSRVQRLVSRYASHPNDRHAPYRQATHAPRRGP